MATSDRQAQRPPRRVKVFANFRELRIETEGALILRINCFSQECAAPPNPDRRGPSSFARFQSAKTLNGDLGMKIYHVRMRGISDAFPTGAGHASSADASQGG